jgi:hypothetical protein
MQEKKNLRGSDKYCAAGGGGVFLSSIIFYIHI